MYISPKYIVAPKEAVKVYPDGREVCSKNAAGRAEYANRLLRMARRQNFRCAITGDPLFAENATFDHESGRGMGGGRMGGGHRDDRITKADGTWQNAALCRRCNALKGSKRYHWNESGQYVPKEAR